MSGWYIAHSAKGTTWEDHKYISRVFSNGRYIYRYKKKSDKTGPAVEGGSATRGSDRYLPISNEKMGNVDRNEARTRNRIENSKKPDTEAIKKRKKIYENKQKTKNITKLGGSKFDTSGDKKQFLYQETLADKQARRGKTKTMTGRKTTVQERTKVMYGTKKKQSDPKITSGNVKNKKKKYYGGVRK